jgi:cephalosporin hydroxylase
MNEIITPNWPIAQKKHEMLMVQELLKNEKIERVLEIGTWTGGTALLWAHMVSKHENGIVFCCDLSFDYGHFRGYEPGTNILREYGQQVYKDSPLRNYIVEIKGDTHDPEFIAKVFQNIARPVDFMFIDGDHTYEGVKADFQNFSSFVKPGGYIAFHDIQDTEIHRGNGCFVAQFWNEVKNNYEHWEFIDANEYQCYELKCPSKSMGIGVIKK